MAAIQTYPIKRGATLSLAGTVQLPAGTWSASAQVRSTTSLSLVEQLSVTLTPPVFPATAHAILIEASSAQSADWPIGTLLCDVRFSDASATPVVLPSPTFAIQVQQEVTNVA